MVPISLAQLANHISAQLVDAPDENLLQKYRRDALTEQLTKQMQHIAKRDVL